MSALLSIQGLSKSFGGLSVIEDVSFDVPEGARVALIGPNGAGKTTLFNLLSGVVAQDAGTITLDGRIIDGAPSRKRIGLGMARSFQNIRLMPHLSVVENIMLGQHCRSGGLGALLTPMRAGGADRRAAVALLEEMGVETSAHAVVATLPYGVRKKIELVRALAARPRLLLLDEPAAGLNDAETVGLRDFLMRISHGGVTLLVVEHDMSFVRSLCPVSVVLNFGRKIHEGPTARVHHDPAVLEAYLGARHGGGAAAGGGGADVA
jgi:branched-chain amino acid transport system ATP-binding protein